MTQKNPLRAVGSDEKPTPYRPLSLTEATEAGDPLEQARSTQRLIAVRLDDPNCPARDMASLSKRHMELGREIQALLAKAKLEADEDGSGATPDEEWDAEAI